jgi:antitoxin YefM
MNQITGSHYSDIVIGPGRVLTRSTATRLPANTINGPALYERESARDVTELTLSSSLTQLCRKLTVVDRQETVIVRRKGARDVALIPASELAGLMETAHLLRSPRNARRLMTALRRAKAGKIKPGTIASLRKEMLSEATA